MKKAMFALAVLAIVAIGGGLFVAQGNTEEKVELPKVTEPAVPLEPVANPGNATCPFQECPAGCTELQLATPIDSGVDECIDPTTITLVSCSGGQTVHYAQHNCDGPGKCNTTRSKKPPYTCQ